MKNLLIFGVGETATIAAEYFTLDSRERLAGFVVDDEFCDTKMLFYGLPVYPLSVALQNFSPEKFKIFVALSYGKMNRARLRVFELFMQNGYEFATYISSKASVWRTAEIGRNCMIFEGNNVQHKVTVHDNVIMWAGNHIGHGSVICHSAYLSSHVCIAGSAKIGERSFIGVNSTVIDQVTVADDCFVTAGAVVNRNTEVNSIYAGNPAIKNTKITALRYFKVKL